MPDVVVQVDAPRQTLEGFGASFNELGWTALALLDPARRAEVLALLGRQPDTDDAVAAQIYDTLLDERHGLCVGGAVEPRALEAVLRLRAEQGGFEDEHDLAALARPGGRLVAAPGS
jgi:hypothetical protein